MRPLRLAMVLGLSLAVLQPEARADGRSDDAAEQAKLAAIGLAIVKEKCARCHATATDDKSPHPQAPPFRDVVTRYPSENLAEALAEGIVSGHPDMPVFIFEPEQIEGFIAYLDSLSPPETSPPAAPAPQNGNASKAPPANTGHGSTK
ncbi:MAG: cytochrome c [Hyphomicrobiaceae bacterium]|nr:cytochrome c [Hyphomicrobiaceae bacterium]